MSILPQRLCALSLLSVLSTAALADKCYVTGDTADNNPSKPIGSRQNPYGTLAAVQGDVTCEKIVVLYSGVALDGGISLRDGQRLRGKTGPGNALPIITNSTGGNDGHGVRLAADNSIAQLQIKDTQNSGVFGDNVGDLSIQHSRITRFAQSEELFPFPPLLTNPAPGVRINNNADANIHISNTDIGEANSASVTIVTGAGHTDITIQNVSVFDQGNLDGASNSQGITVFGVGQSTVDIQVRNTSISNIGEGDSSSDALLCLAIGSSAMTVLIDGYEFVNPDGDGNPFAAGIEVGTFFGNGASFEGTIKNSVIRGATGQGILAIDSAGPFPGFSSNFLDVEIRDNEVYDSSKGIAVEVGRGAPNGTHIVRIEDNLVVDPLGNGIDWSNQFPPGNTLDHLLIQRNTIVNAGNFGMAFEQKFGASSGSLILDAGLGGLGSEGKNRVINSQTGDIAVTAEGADPFHVDAANNWWGSDTGPANVVQDGGAAVDVTPFLTEDPSDNQ